MLVFGYAAQIKVDLWGRIKLLFGVPFYVSASLHVPEGASWPAGSKFGLAHQLGNGVPAIVQKSVSDAPTDLIGEVKGNA